jgi:hypothetical protein
MFNDLFDSPTDYSLTQHNPKWQSHLGGAGSPVQLAVVVH